MHPSVYAVLLTCLCGSSFGAPIGVPVNQATGLLEEVTKGLPVDGVAENLVGGIAKRTFLPTPLGNSVPVGQDADGLTHNGFENILGDLAKGADVGSVVPSSTDKGFLDGLPVKSENELPQGLPLAGSEEKRDTGLPFIGSESKLLKGLPLVGDQEKQGAGLPLGPGSELLKSIPIVGDQEKQGAGSESELLKNIPIIGGKKKRDTGLPVGPGSDLLKNIPIVGGQEKQGAGSGSSLKDIPLVGGEGKQGAGLPLGNVDQVLEPVTEIVDGPLKSLPVGP